MKNQSDRPLNITICGKDLRDYTPVLYFPDGPGEDYKRLNRPLLVKKLEETTKERLGFELPVRIEKEPNCWTEKTAERAIVFGSVFRRAGIPETDPRRSFYGITEQGTVYFRSPSIILFSYLWECFLDDCVRAAGDGFTAELSAFRKTVPDWDPEELRREGYVPVFEDRFEGPSLDPDVWLFRHPGPSGAAYLAGTDRQIRVKDGTLTLLGNYREDGEFGPGWYGVEVALKKHYRYGYFEAKIRVPLSRGRGRDFSAGFWIQGPHPYDPEKSLGGIGPGGAEIDIMENWGPDYMTSCYFCAEEGRKDLTMELFNFMDVGNDLTDGFHTYSLLWDEKEYRTYVDGILISRTRFVRGTATIEEEVIFSLQSGNSLDTQYDNQEMVVTDFRIWQKPEAPEPSAT